MKKNVLVIGGSYFAGRVFAILCARREDISLTFLNRGRYSMAGVVPGCREFACDRRDAAALSRIPADDYDAVVDFCAYEPDDIRRIFACENLKFRKYIYFSTADVYDRTGYGAKDETCPLTEGKLSGNAVSDYISKKALLEQELKECCEATGRIYTILRPAFIYGPYNYAQRESYYIERIVKSMPVPDVTDSASSFQMVYVKDVGNAAVSCILNDVSDNKAYNLSAPEVMNYASYMQVLHQVSDIPFQSVPVTVAQVLEQRIAVPFPLNKEESELYDGTLIQRELGLEYTPVEKGMELTWKAFKPVFAR